MGAEAGSGEPASEHRARSAARAPLRALFERSATPMALFDGDQRYHDLNRAASSLLGIDRAKIRELRIGDLSPPDEREAVTGMWKRLLSDGELSGQAVMQRADGERVEVDISASANAIEGLHLALFAPRGSDREVFGDESGATQGDGKLTEREREVLTALALGETGVEIAARLFIAPDTVRRHVANARRKLGARTRAHAVAVAIRRGEIKP